jgi:predicted metal-dependent TIM-barrel fold hydrolase
LESDPATDNRLDLPPLFIDSHVHLDHIVKDRPHRIPWLARVRCFPISWAFSKGVKTTADLEAYLARQAEVIRNVNRDGLPSRYLTGVHPRNIPRDLRPEEVAGLIRPYLDDPVCAGIGEIGLETGSDRETEILRAHLDLAKEAAARGKVLGIHTPRENKDRITERLLQVLSSFSKWFDHMVVDHCTPETMGRVLDMGLWAGMTLSPVKSSPEDLDRVTRDYTGALDRILLNTDSGSCFYEDLYRVVQGGMLPRKVCRKLVLESACRFYGLKEVQFLC